MPQRHHKDTYFGELVLLNSKTGDNIADNIRYDIMEGITAKMRLYNKKADKYEFQTKYIFPQDYDEGAYKAQMEAESGRSIETIIYGYYGDINLPEYASGRLSATNNLYRFVHEVGLVNAFGRVTPTTTEMSITREYINGGGNLEYEFTDGTTWDSGHYVAGAGTHTGFYAEYREANTGYVYSFFSTSPVFANQENVEVDASVMPVVSFQDGRNNEQPYATMPYSDWDFERRKKILDVLGIDFEEMSKQVFPYVPPIDSTDWEQSYGWQWRATPRIQTKYATEQDYHDQLTQDIAVPVIGTKDWDRDYGRVYYDKMRDCANDVERIAAGQDSKLRDDQKEFCSDYPDEQTYYDDLVSDKEDADKGIKNITDVHFGFFASAKLLDEPNIVALYYTLLPILPHIVLGPAFGAKQYKLNLESGTLKINYAFKDWSVCRRYGVANEILYPPGISNPKYKHTHHIIKERDDEIPEWTLAGSDPTYEHTRAPNEGTGETPPLEEGGSIIPAFLLGGTGYLELRVQDRIDENGNPRYLEMRLYGPYAEHIVDVIKDGEHGKSGRVAIRGGLHNYYLDDVEKPYSDVLIWPLSYEGIREVPFFKRERLMREAMVLNIGAIQMQEIEWYEKGWFKIVMIIIALVISYFFPPAGVSMLASLLTTAVTMAVLYILSMVIENPILRAILQIAAMFYGQYAMTGSVSFNAAIIAEATGTIIQATLAIQMQKLQDEIMEWRKHVNEKMEEFEEMQKLVGNDGHNASWMLYVSQQTPPGEEPEVFYNRTQTNSLQLPSVDLDGSVDTVVKLPNASNQAK